jgi:hypothetical protein
MIHTYGVAGLPRGWYTLIGTIMVEFHSRKGVSNNKGETGIRTLMHSAVPDVEDLVHVIRLGELR